MRSVVVVGSGAAGVGAMLGLVARGCRPIVLDVGLPFGSSAPRFEESFHEYASRHDRFDAMIGKDYAGLSNLLTNVEVPVKLTAPVNRYVTNQPELLSGTDCEGFSPVQSFARGGLANAWGAGLYRFVDADMAGFPIRAADLDPAFDALTRQIGIAGADDDLTGDFGSTADLLPPLKLSRNVSQLYRRYQRIGHRDDIRIGRARIAALSSPRDARVAFRYRADEFFQEDTALYSPRYTLDELIASGAIDYRPGLVVERFSTSGSRVTLYARTVMDGAPFTVEADDVLLAAGAIGTSRIVLASFADTETVLPLRENPAFQFPLVLPSALGRRLETDAFGLVQLNLVWDSSAWGHRLQGSIMEITSPARAEFFAGFPYAARNNLALIRQMLPAMLVMQLFFPGDAQPAARISLQQNGRLRIVGQPNTLSKRNLGPLLRYLLRLGCVTAPPLIVRVPTGHAVHYAATLPMADSPQRYQCHPDGRLAGADPVRIVDAACFTRLPAKNMSFGMMANAYRIAGLVAAKGNA